MSDTPWLTDEELKELTGYMQPRRQARWLTTNGIRCYRNALGRVRVSRDALASGEGQKKRRTEPNLAAVRRVGT